ncbi:MAG TPA: EAL domain-containing protein [Burkholderiaceae bacterium]|nr:EAL domain-containing protein [Burkholderiaceae bacterium]
MTLLVLQIESEAAHRDALLDAVGARTLPWRLQVAGSVRQAREMLASASPDAILVSHRLADGTAFDLLPDFAGRPSILCVAPGEEPAAARALHEGFSDYLIKDAGLSYLEVLPEQVAAALRHADVLRRLRETTERYEVALAGADAGLWDWRFHSGGSTVNERWWTMLGYRPGEFDLQGNGWLTLVHPDDRAGVQAAMDFAGKPDTPRQYEIEFRMRHKEGHWIWIQSRGKVVEQGPEGQPLRLAGTHVDVTERRRAETERRLAQMALQKTSQLLEHKSQMLEDMLNSISQGISLVDAGNKLLAYNPRYLELLELPEPLVATLPTVEKIVQFQTERGDFGQGFDLIEQQARDYVASQYLANGAGLNVPDLYLRKTRAGRVIEVRTRMSLTGNRVRTFTDVTSYLETQSALRESEARFRSLTELMTDWYWELDAQGQFMRSEASGTAQRGVLFRQTLGKAAQEAVGQTVRATQEQWQEWDARIASRREFRDFVFPVESADTPGLRYFSMSGLPVFDEQGVFSGYRGTGRDITAQKLAEAEIERLAFYDVLCGLPNRRLLMNRLAQALAASARSGQHGALLFIDLDNFKDLNDTLGHDMGDTLLGQVAKRLVGCVRESDTVARFGGDEFVVMLEDLNAGLDEAVGQVEAAARKILQALNRPYDLDGREHHSTPSIGITVFNNHEQSVDELIKRADVAMYQAKAAGRNTLRFFDPQMQSAVADRSALEADLRQGLLRGELRLYYQPVVDEQMRVIGAEALVRWQHPLRGMVSPAQFIPMAEQSGLILPLGQWVLQTACRQLAAWARSPQTAGIALSVNVSARQFRQPDFVAQVLAVLAQSGASAQRLTLELTESLLLSDVKDVIAKMNDLKAHGIGFALDDFGTGYSSLAYLKRLPLDQLKIDQSFVGDVLTNANDAAIARTILALAHSLDLGVVAEGVETEGQRAFLLRNGCKAFQGYLFGKPQPVADFTLAHLATNETKP